MWLLCGGLELRYDLACPRSAMRLHHLSIRYRKSTCEACRPSQLATGNWALEVASPGRLELVQARIGKLDSTKDVRMVGCIT